MPTPQVPMVAGAVALVLGAHLGFAAPQGPITTTFINDRVEMRFADGSVLARPAQEPLHAGGRGRRDLIFDLDVQPVADGFDAILTIANPTTESLPGGKFHIGEFLLGPSISWQDFNTDGHADTITLDEQTHPRGWGYPMQLYSPVAVARNNDFAVGVSIQYPVLEYEQSVRIELVSPTEVGGDGKAGWAIDIWLANRGDSYNDDVPAGASREYRITVRVSDEPDEWIRTLVPYREYFRNMYGGVSYTRDPRPIKATSIALQSRANSSSPLGFTRSSMRPDVHGWEPWADEFKRNRHDWNRLMVWTPTGVYRRNHQNNFPFLFTSHWLEGAQYGHNMGDAVAELSQVPGDDFALGLWWGRSCQVMREWDMPAWEPLDPDNSEHVQLAFTELDLAAQAGATMIGLDAFAHAYTPTWKLHGWLRAMQERYPQITFISESRNPDILHRLAPTYIDAYVFDPRIQDVEQLRVVKSPLVLADFLLPGHETWAGLAFNRIKQAYVGGDVPTHVIRAEAQRAAQLGYVPVIFANEAPRAQEFDAVESWRTTVPADLQLAPGPSVQIAGDDSESSSGAAAATGNNSGAGGSSNSGQDPSVTSSGIVIVNSGDGAVGAPSDGEVHRPFEDEAEKPKRRRPLVFLRGRNSRGNDDDDDDNEGDDDGE